MPNEEQNQPLQQPLVSGSLLEEIRQAFADYYASEGCSCCQDIEPHEKASLRLGELLGNTKAGEVLISLADCYPQF